MLARREFWPDITLRGAYNSLWPDERKRFVIGAAVNIPLPIRRRARLDQVHAETLRLQAQWQSQKVELLAQLQSAYAQVQESRHVIELYRRRLVPLALESLKAAQAAYASGGGDFLDLLTAEKHLIAVRLQLEQARSEHLRRLATLERLCGVASGIFPEGRP